MCICGRRVQSRRAVPSFGGIWSISCSFKAQPFVIHGFSFTSNNITWLLCQDSGLATLIWESPCHWRHGLIYNAKTILPWALCVLKPYPWVPIAEEKHSVHVNFDPLYVNLFFFFLLSHPKKKAHNSDFNLHPQSFCVGSSKCMLSLFELIFNIDFYFTLVIGLPIYWLITKHTPCSREKAVDISVSQSSLQNCYKFPSIPVEIYVHFMCSLWF